MLGSASTGERDVVKKIGFIVLLLLPTALIAQSSESATGGEAKLSAGAEMSAFNPDWGCTTSSPFCTNELIGPAAFFDFDLHGKYGVEGEARWLNFHGAGGEVEQNYLAGPRYRFFRYHRLSGWLKVELGGGWITTINYPAAGSLKGSYFAYAPGGTLQYPLSRRWILRGDYEWQFWPSFAGPPTFNPTTGTVVQHNSGLTPNGISVGVAYRFLGQ
jgi:hypothetical protein